MPRSRRGMIQLRLSLSCGLQKQSALVHMFVPGPHLPIAVWARSYDWIVAMADASCLIALWRFVTNWRTWRRHLAAARLKCFRKHLLTYSTLALAFIADCRCRSRVGGIRHMTLHRCRRENGAPASRSFGRRCHDLMVRIQTDPTSYKSYAGGFGSTLASRRRLTLIRERPMHDGTSPSCFPSGPHPETVPLCSSYVRG